jgi:hypothetical protein
MGCFRADADPETIARAWLQPSAVQQVLAALPGAQCQALPFQCKMTPLLLVLALPIAHAFVAEVTARPRMAKFFVGTGVSFQPLLVQRRMKGRLPGLPEVHPGQ